MIGGSRPGWYPPYGQVVTVSTDEVVVMMERQGELVVARGQLFGQVAGDGWCMHERCIGADVNWLLRVPVESAPRTAELDATGAAGQVAVQVVDDPWIDDEGTFMPTTIHPGDDHLAIAIAADQHRLVCLSQGVVARLWLSVGINDGPGDGGPGIHEHELEPVSYTHLRAHETDSYLVCR